MMSLSTCAVMAGVIGAKGIAATGNIGRTAKVQAAKPISIKRFIEANSLKHHVTARLRGKCLATYKVPWMTNLTESKSRS
jgi:hypothetical protein